MYNLSWLLEKETFPRLQFNKKMVLGIRLESEENELFDDA
jgi:hypothetical protein